MYTYKRASISSPSGGPRGSVTHARGSIMMKGLQTMKGDKKRDSTLHIGSDKNKNIRIRRKSMYLMNISTQDRKKTLSVTMRSANEAFRDRCDKLLKIPIYPSCIDVKMRQKTVNTESLERHILDLTREYRDVILMQPVKPTSAPEEFEIGEDVTGILRRGKPAFYYIESQKSGESSGLKITLKYLTGKCSFFASQKTKFPSPTDHEWASTEIVGEGECSVKISDSSYIKNNANINIGVYEGNSDVVVNDITYRLCNQLTTQRGGRGGRLNAAADNDHFEQAHQYHRRVTPRCALEKKLRELRSNDTEYARSFHVRISNVLKAHKAKLRKFQKEQLAELHTHALKMRNSMKSPPSGRHMQQPPPPKRGHGGLIMSDDNNPPLDSTRSDPLRINIEDSASDIMSPFSSPRLDHESAASPFEEIEVSGDDEGLIYLHSGDELDGVCNEAHPNFYCLENHTKSSEPLGLKIWIKFLGESKVHCYASQSTKYPSASNCQWMSSMEEGLKECRIRVVPHQYRAPSCMDPDDNKDPPSIRPDHNIYVSVYGDSMDHDSHYEMKVSHSISRTRRLESQRDMGKHKQVDPNNTGNNSHSSISSKVDSEPVATYVDDHAAT